MKHKLKLKTIKIKSFITSEDLNITTIRGGSEPADRIPPSVAPTCSGTTVSIFGSDTCVHQ